MTLIHIVLFKFISTATKQQQATLIKELKQLRSLPSVKSNRLVVGGPTVSDPTSRSKGFHYALVSYHEDQKALAEYQGSKEHLSVVNTHLVPIREEVIAFDFEVPGEDEKLLGFTPAGFDGKDLLE